jgi:hypothetical protein
MNDSATLDQQLCGGEFPVKGRYVQWGIVIIIHCLDVRTMFK